jgi:competence protein ComEC
MKGRHLLAGIIGFALGIVFEAYLKLGWFGGAYFILCAIGTTLLFMWKRAPFCILIACLLCGIALGVVRTGFVSRELPEAFAYLVGTETVLEGTVVRDPDIRETSQRLTIQVQEGKERTKVLVVAPRYPSISYGETLRASGTLEVPEPFESGEGRTFAYDTFLAKDGVFLIMRDARAEVLLPRQGVGTHIRGALSDLKTEGIGALTRALSEPAASLAGGLILGGKQGLGEKLLDDFIRSGLVHIVVLSGYNVMIVAEFVMRIFGFLRGSLAPALGAVSIAVFVLVAGAGPASIRAGIMAAIALYARATGHTYAAVRALLFAGFLMLLWNPLTLPYDPGFQLSFIATLGLIFGAPVAERWLGFIKSTFLREIMSATLAAQVSVLPLLLYQNGLFSVVALPANLLVLPVVPLAMLASFVAMLAGWAVPFAAPVLGFPAYVLLSYIIGVVEVASSLPLAAFFVPAFPFVFVIAAYALLTMWLIRETASR